MSFQINPKGIRYNRPDSTGVLREMRSETSAYLKSIGSDGKADLSLLMKGLFWVGMVVFCQYNYLFGSHSSWTIDLLWATGSGLSSLFFLFNLGHESVHGLVFRSRRLNRLLHSFAFNLLGVSSYLWEIRHNYSHHTFPNVNGCDADIDENPILRLSPNHPQKPYQRFQHIYALPIYSIVHLHLLLFQDLQYFRKRSLANLTHIQHRKTEAGRFLFGKIQYFTLNLILPMMLLPYSWSAVVAMFLGSSMIVSLAFVLPLIGTHFSDLVEFPEADGEGRLPGDFLQHQISTCLDWHSQSRIARWFFGGLNAHLTHHVIPHVSHVHFDRVTEIIDGALIKHGLERNQVSLLGCVQSHFRFLKKMGS